MPGNLQGVPKEVLAGWPKPNYVDPVRRTWIIPFVIALQVLMTVVVGTRIYLRARNQAGPLGLDDAVLLPAWLSATMFTAIVVLATEQYGTDRHVWDVRPDKIVSLVLTAWIGEFAFIVSTVCTKVSVLMFYRRMVKGTFSKLWKFAIISAITFTVMYGVAILLTLIFNCQPTEAYWRAWNPLWEATHKYHCTNTQILNPISGALSVFTDLYAVLLPMAMMWNFEAPKRQKIALNAVFSIGLLVVAAGSIRTYYLWRLGTSYDTTWAGYNVYVWAAIETHLALICAAAPALRVFFRRYLSDPISRAINTTRSHTSSGRGTKRDSRYSEGTLTNSRARDSIGGTNSSYNNNYNSGDYGDKTPIVKYQMKNDLDPVHEDEDFPELTNVRSQGRTIKTADDYEAYALQNLEKNRPATRSTMMRFNDGPNGLRPALNEPFTEWYQPNKSNQV